MDFKFLIGPELEAAEQQMPLGQRVNWPLDTMVLYVFENERVVGRMGVMSIKIIEGTWVEPGQSTLAFRMMKQMEEFLKSVNNTHASAFVYDEQPQIAEYLKRVGFERFPVTMFIKDLYREENAA